MPRNEPTASDRLWTAALAAVIAVTAARVASLWLLRTELFVDEAQYWLWGQDLDLGYYSKPPMIAWVIRAATELAGSDAAPWVRLPAPLFHGITALLLMAAGRRLAGARVGALTGIVYVSTPLAALGSVQISTDTILFPFFALAFLLYLRAVETRGARVAFLAGLALGLGFLAKYAAVYFALGAVLAALAPPRARPGWQAAGAMAAGFVLAAMPNLAWNAVNGLTTVSHTMDNADWVRDPAARAGLNLSGLAVFFAAQFLFFGPVTFAALLWAGARSLAGRGGRAERLTVLFSLPVVALICGQALLSEANGNWAAPAYLAGTLAVTVLLADRAPRLLAAGIALNAAIALAIPMLAAGADRVTLDGEKLLLKRLVGRVATSERILDAASRAGAAAIVVDGHRDILADLFHTGRNAGIPLYALPPAGRPMSHYEDRHAYAAPAPGTVLFVRMSHDAPDCPATRIDAWTAAAGAYRGRDFAAWAVAGDCPDLAGR